MITLPSTLGLFDRNIVQIAEMVHAHGALMYGDGANLNAMLGQVKPGDLGFDVMHINLHKTFSQPHGGGGPGAGPIVVKEHLAAVPPVAARRCGDGDARYTRSSTRRSTASAGSARSTATSACCCARTRTSAASAPTACARSARRRC